MNKILLPVLLLVASIFPQERGEYLSEENRIKFGDYLFCSGDYLRAAEEYEGINNDTVKIKAAISLAEMGEWRNSLARLRQIKGESEEISRRYYFKILFQNNIEEFRGRRNELRGDTVLERLNIISSLFEEGKPVEFRRVEEKFEEEEREELTLLFSKRREMRLKSAEGAAIISAVIPGGGKVYTENYGDAITSFIPIALFTYLAIVNFNADHNFRGYLFSGLAGLFYAGNIYGAYKAAEIFNAGIKYDLGREVDLYLNKKNYFIPERMCR